jgi:hypothetical protein
MKERPILFSAPMVRALLDGRKTQTRRIAKPGTVVPIPPGLIGEVVLPCPYGQPGDRLWVRETHAFIWPEDYPPERLQDHEIQYRADTDGKCFAGEWPEEERDNEERPKWKPSIFMPRWASRILLEITDVRVERLQDISEEDARAEGVEISDEWTGCADDLSGSHVKSYQFLWESINGTGSWDANPFVWVISFRGIEP